MKDKDRFLDFPIVLLKGFLEGHNKCLSDIYCFAVYKMVYSDEAIYEDIEEFENAYVSKPNHKLVNSIEIRGRLLYGSFEGIKYVWTGIHIDTFRRFFNVDRTEFDLVCLLAYLALKSIVQKDKIKFNISNEFLLSRIAGNEKSEPIENIPPKIQKYLKNRSRLKSKLFDVLERSYGVVRPTANTRGIVCSLTLSKKELELEIMKREYKKSREHRKQENQAAKDQAKKEFEKWKQSLSDNEEVIH